MFQAAEKNKYANYPGLFIHPALTILQGDRRWKKLTKQVDQNRLAKIKKPNKKIIRQLDKMYIKDQGARGHVYDSMEKKFGFNSKEMDAYLLQVTKEDEANAKKVTRIIDKQGWLGIDEVGSMGAYTLFLVIQHASPALQMKYLPLLKEQVKAQQASPTHLGFLEDRIEVMQGRPQIYGTQLKIDNATGKRILLPIKDPENIDKRRAEIYLEPIAEYLKKIGLVWDIEAQKKAAQ